jgi:hypothetical protein
MAKQHPSTGCNIQHLQQNVDYYATLMARTCINPCLVSLLLPWSSRSGDPPSNNLLPRGIPLVGCQIKHWQLAPTVGLIVEIIGRAWSASSSRSIHSTRCIATPYISISGSIRQVWDRIFEQATTSISGSRLLGSTLTHDVMTTSTTRLDFSSLCNAAVSPLTLITHVDYKLVGDGS